MKKIILSTIVLTAFCAASFAQATDAKITLNARGTDIRATLANIFEQARKSYILQPNLHGVVYTSLEDVDFEAALKLICNNNGLGFEVKDGVYYVHAGASVAATTKPTELEIKPVTTSPSTAPKTTQKSAIKPEAPVAKPTKTTSNPVKIAKLETPTEHVVHVLPISVLDSKITARVQRGDIRKVLSDFGKQAKIKIEIGTEVPTYRIDAYLLNTSLKYALDKITDAAGLEYRFTENFSIAISKPKSGKIALRN